MFCPECGTNTDSNFCPNCGYDLRKIPVRNSDKLAAPQKKVQKNIYFGDTRITATQYKEIHDFIKAGEKLEAIKRIRTWTSLSLADAVNIADNFNSIDFSRPQTLIHVNKAQKNHLDQSTTTNQKKAQNAVKAVGKGAGMAAFATGALGFRILSNLTKMYTKKRR